MKRLGLVLILMAALPVSAAARSVMDFDGKALAAFADNCFSPFMTAARAARVLDLENARYDFYDLDPFSASNAPSPPRGRPATPGTDRRCEVAVDADIAEAAVAVIAQKLADEGITTPARVPATYAATPTTTLLAARRLNPRKVAVVHVGTRPGPNGIETFMFVERLTPAASEGL